MPVNFPMTVAGTAQPYLALFNPEGSPILNSNTGLPLGAYITNFSYKTDEGKENQATIVIDSGTPDLVDGTEVQEGSEIIIQFGYIYPSGRTLSCEPISIKVKDVDLLFDDRGTHITLKCIDASFVARLTPAFIPLPEGTGEDSFTLEDYMDRGCNNCIGIIIRKYKPL